jgi:hypothetical protein
MGAAYKTAVTKILLPHSLKRDPDFYPARFSDGTHFRADGTLLSAAGSWGGIPMSKIKTIAIFWRRNLDTVLIRGHYNRALPGGDSLCVR